MNIIKYNKLVRDNIIDIIEADGKEAIYTKITDKYEKLEYLNAKLIEEVNEYGVVGDIEELADVLEVIYAILETKGHTDFYIDSIRKSKNEKNGAFKEGIVLREVIESVE